MTYAITAFYAKKTDTLLPSGGGQDTVRYLYSSNRGAAGTFGGIIYTSRDQHLKTLQNTLKHHWFHPECLGRSARVMDSIYAVEEISAERLRTLLGRWYIDFFYAIYPDRLEMHRSNNGMFVLEELRIIKTWTKEEFLAVTNSEPVTARTWDEDDQESQDEDDLDEEEESEDDNFFYEED